MPLELRPLHEGDLEEVVRLQFTAFTQTSIASRSMWINGVTDDLVNYFVKLFKSAMDKYATFNFVVTDTNTGEIVGYAFWKREDEKTEADRKDKRKDEEASKPPDCNLDAKEYFIGGIHRLRPQVMGDRYPYWHLNSIATKRGHERRGVAQLALDWGLQKADEEGLETFLDATPIGKPLYARNGFEVKHTTIFDFKAYGQDGSEEYCVMIRQPRRGV